MVTDKGAQKKEKKQQSGSRRDHKQPIPASYFELVSYYIYGLVILFLIMGFLAAVDPDTLDSIPAVGSTLHDNANMLATAFYIFFVLNIGFTALAVKRCKSYGLNIGATFKWVVQTVLVGFPSYNLLNKAG